MKAIIVSPTAFCGLSVSLAIAGGSKMHVHVALKGIRVQTVEDPP